MLRTLQLFRKIGTSLRNETIKFPKRSYSERFEFYEEMPKSKEYLSSDDSDSSGEKAPKRKREKEDKKSSRDKAAKAESNDSSKKQKTSSDDGEAKWEIGNNRFVTVRDFKGKLYIDIREMYMDNSGDLKPGRKGISLTAPQWKKLTEYVGEVDQAVKQMS